MEEMLSFYQGLLGLRFEPDEQLTKEAWAPGVKGYRVRSVGLPPLALVQPAPCGSLVRWVSPGESCVCVQIGCSLLRNRPKTCSLK
jgi:hypothetical protein